MTQDQSRLTWALVLSVLLHGLLLSLVPLLRRARLEIPAPPALVDVDLVQLPKAPPQAPAVAAPAPQPPALAVPKRQIVSPSDEGEEKEPENPRFLSDRDNTVKEETIHRGEPAAGNPETKHQAPPQQVASTKVERPRPAPAPVAPREAQRSRSNPQEAALPNLDQLLPKAGDLIREGLVQPEAPAPASAPEQQASNQRSDLLRHSDPWRNGGLRGGSLDFLPAIRDGDITLLNTKAEQFAPFVRRVAVRVFENFWILLRRSVSSGQVESVEEFATIEAVMDKQGQLLEITARDRSARAALATDRNLEAACREGFFDRNPPHGAEASDGKIHFVFDARVALQINPNGRGVAGYRALFGAELQ